MRLADQLALACGSLLANRIRTFLILLAMATGIAGVVLLTWLGECARTYVADQFSGLGSNLVIVLPGRNETTGGAPPPLGESARDLTIDDAFSLERSAAVKAVVPVVAGGALVAWGNREREATVMGTTAMFLPVRRIEMAWGSFLPGGDPRSAPAVCVLGRTLREELFGSMPALGEWVRVGDRRYRVIGQVASTGRSLGTDLDEMVVLPVAAAQALFDTPALFRVLVEARSNEAIPRVVADAERILQERHEGELDVTVITQQSILDTFDGILRALTLAVAGIAAISLVVAGILIMNVMVISVSQRHVEVGLLKSMGATPSVIARVFLWESVLLSLGGALAGIALGELVSRIAPAFVDALHPGTPPWSVGAALGVSLLTGIGFGVEPARRAAALDPVLALQRRA